MAAGCNCYCHVPGPVEEVPWGVWLFLAILCISLSILVYVTLNQPRPPPPTVMVDGKVCRWTTKCYPGSPLSHCYPEITCL